MANSYIYIECEFCGSRLRVAGYVPSLDLQISDGVFPKLNAWLNEHLLCHQEAREYKPSLSTPGLKFIVKQI